MLTAEIPRHLLEFNLILQWQPGSYFKSPRRHCYNDISEMIESCHHDHEMNELNILWCFFLPISLTGSFKGAIKVADLSWGSQEIFLTIRFCLSGKKRQVSVSP